MGLLETRTTPLYNIVLGPSKQGLLTVNKEHLASFATVARAVRMSFDVGWRKTSGWWRQTSCRRLTGRSKSVSFPLRAHISYCAEVQRKVPIGSGCLTLPKGMGQCGSCVVLEVRGNTKPEKDRKIIARFNKLIDKECFKEPNFLSWLSPFSKVLRLLDVKG